MKQLIKRALLQVPFGNALSRTLHSYREPVSLGRFNDARELFTQYFAENVWGEPESASGPGSTLAYTENIRRELPAVIARLGIRRLLDAPCGDFNWFRAVARDGVDYIGGDIVEPLIAQNNHRYGDQTTRFVQLDIRHDRMPEADLWMCRDCFQHLCEHEIVLALDNFLRSGIRYLLTSIHPDCTVNSDGPTGATRKINLILPPFRFGEPRLVLDDWLPGFDRRQLALWERDAVAHALQSNRIWQRIVRRRSRLESR